MPSLDGGSTAQGQLSPTNDGASKDRSCFKSEKYPLSCALASTQKNSGSITPFPTNMLEYRFRYYLKKACKLLGFCYRCRSTLNFTRNGTGVCPRCSLRH